MDTSTIIARLKQRHNIEQLNEMQQYMAGTQCNRLILLSPTGSGKTAAFTLRLLRAVGAPCGKVQALVLAPSRELVLQIADVIRPVAAGLKTVAFYGGHPMEEEVKSLAVTPDIIVATPGRMLDHINRSTVDVAAVDTLVLDEYDKSLELGFHDQMSRIARRIRRPGLLLLTSATPLTELPSFLPMQGAETVDFSASARSSRLQIVRINSPERDKLATLADLLRSLPQGRAIVFVNHRESASRVHTYLCRHRFPAGLYNGALEQRDRQMALELFNNGTTPILVSTDLASRGLDIADVNYVIHYHLPLTPEGWTHRNGRTARMGADGTAFVIIAEEENIPQAVRWDREIFPGTPLPSGQAIASDVATLYFNLGKKEKISKGDIAGYLMQKGGLGKDEVGRITVWDHSAVAAIPRPKLQTVLAALKPHKLKGKSVRVSVVSVPSAQ